MPAVDRVDDREKGSETPLTMTRRAIKFSMVLATGFVACGLVIGGARGSTLNKWPNESWKHQVSESDWSHSSSSWKDDESDNHKKKGTSQSEKEKFKKYSSNHDEDKSWGDKSDSDWKDDSDDWDSDDHHDEDGCREYSVCHEMTWDEKHDDEHHHKHHHHHRDHSEHPEKQPITPIPASAILFGSGLAALGWGHRFMSRKPTPKDDPTK